MTIQRPSARAPSNLPKGYRARILTTGELRYYAHIQYNGSTIHLGSFPTFGAAAAARNMAIQELPNSTEERELSRAFDVIERQAPGLWHLRGMTDAEQIAKIQTFSPKVRLLVLRWVPAEDDPIYAVLCNMSDGSLTLEAIASLYGCTRERIRQIEECATTKIRRLGYIDHYRDYARLESQTPLEVIVGCVW